MEKEDSLRELIICQFQVIQDAKMRFYHAKCVTVGISMFTVIKI